MIENKYDINVSHEIVSFVKPVVERNVESKDFLSGKDISLGNINKEEITKNIEDKDIKADSKSSIEVIQEIKYDHNLTSEQLEREE